MEHINIEIKARSTRHNEIRKELESRNAIFKGTDHQIDTYFKVYNGRLKLREGNIENNLIHYLRDNKEGPKQSDVTLFKSEPNTSLKELLSKSLGVLVVVDKKREIYFIDNVKFHIDTVQNLGTFVEIEVINNETFPNKEKLQVQCQYYMDLFNISEKDLIPESYSDMLQRYIKSNNT